MARIYSSNEPWFCGNAKGDTDEDWQAAGAPTAKKIADEYELAITTSWYNTVW